MSRDCPRWLTVPEVARVLGVSRGTAYTLSKKGEIPAKRFEPRTIRVSEEDLAAYTQAKPDYESDR